MDNKLRQKLRNKFSRSRILKKKLNLEDLPNSENKKFILIQIDGLPYTLLQKLKDTKYMPFLGSLLKSYNLSKFDPGYPSTTPFVQAGIIYGDNFNIPAFRFYDKEKGLAMELSSEGIAKLIEDELELKNKGMLRGGTSIGTIFSGGADRAVLTMSKITQSKATPKSFKDIMQLILLHPKSSLKVLFFSFSELFIEMIDSVIDIFRSLKNGGHFNWPFFPPYIPFYRIMINSIAKEVSTRVALLEMDRNVPYMYIVYIGFDLIGHYRGPENLSSYSVLRQIDIDVKKLYQKAIKQDYDVYIVSDHGMVPSMPFHKVYHETFEDFVERISKIKVEATKGDTERSGRTNYVYYKLKYYYRNFSVPLKAASWAMINILNLAFKREQKRFKTHSNKRKGMSIHYSSSLADIYFTDYKGILNKKDIEKNHPYMLDKLVGHPGVGFIIVKDGNNYEVLSDNGKVIIKPSSVVFEGERFLKIYGDEERLVKQIRVLVKQKYSPDIIVNGNFDGKKIIAFEEFHFGSHDSIGAGQNDAFLISKEKLDLSEVTNAKELNKIFERYHQKGL
ncbi:MAG: alkaline phosphatase family protein [Nanoarchaeota archaeon]|nr:alkaline phosphatase family protein [Nanoarchaeota archaeon]